MANTTNVFVGLEYTGETLYKGYGVEAPKTDLSGAFLTAKSMGFERVTKSPGEGAVDSMAAYYAGFCLTISPAYMVAKDKTPIVQVSIQEKDERGAYKSARIMTLASGNKSTIDIEPTRLVEVLTAFKGIPPSPNAKAKAGPKVWSRSSMPTRSFVEAKKTTSRAPGGFQYWRNSTVLGVIVRGAKTISSDLRVDDGVEKPGAEAWFQLDVRALAGGEFHSFDIIYNGEEWSMLANRGGRFYRVVPEAPFGNHEFTWEDKAMWDEAITASLAE